MRFHFSVASGVDMDADEDDIGFAEGCAVGVDAADAFFFLRGGIFVFRDEGNKKDEFQLQATGTRFSLIYSADGRYCASQIHSYFKNQTR